MGCQHYGDRGGVEWCNHYNQPIDDLKSQPVKPGEEVEVEVEDIHESGAGVGRTEDGFIIMVDGVLPPARSLVKVIKVRSNFARAEEIERLPEDPDDAADGDDAAAVTDEADDDESSTGDTALDGKPQLGSRDNFWGG
jgi:predicted RNA-binding protein with TRAM domain